VTKLSLKNLEFEFILLLASESDN